MIIFINRRFYVTSLVFLSIMNTSQLIRLLRDSEIFRAVSNEMLLPHKQYLHEQGVPAGECIVQKNEFGDSLFVIVSGAVKVHDQEYVVAELRQGEIFGEMAFLDPGPRSMSVTAIEESVIVNVDKELLNEI